MNYRNEIKVLEKKKMKMFYVHTRKISITV